MIPAILKRILTLILVLVGITTRERHHRLKDVPLILKILHDLNIFRYHNSRGLRYLNSSRNSNIHGRMSKVRLQSAAASGKSYKGSTTVGAYIITSIGFQTPTCLWNTVSQIDLKIKLTIIKAAPVLKTGMDLWGSH